MFWGGFFSCPHFFGHSFPGPNLTLTAKVIVCFDNLSICFTLKSGPVSSPVKTATIVNIFRHYNSCFIHFLRFTIIIYRQFFRFDFFIYRQMHCLLAVLYSFFAGFTDTLQSFAMCLYSLPIAKQFAHTCL